jgi:hypothetical protein
VPSRENFSDFQGRVFVYMKSQKKTAGAKSAKAVTVKRMGKACLGAEFKRWLESAPELSGSEQTLTIDLKLELYADEWVNLSRIARERGWPLEEAASQILSDNLMNNEWEQRKARAASLLESWNSATPEARRVIAKELARQIS